MVQEVKRKRVAIYCRVSTADQSCDRQVRDLTEHAINAGWEIVGEPYKETASGTKNDRAVRKQVLALAQSRKIDIILVTEMTRFGRSTEDLIENLQFLASVDCSLIAQTGLTFDISTAQGLLIARLMASLASFERDLIVERVKSGLENAKARGKKLGRQQGQCVTQDKVADKVMAMIAEGRTYRQIADRLNISKTTVVAIVKKAKTQQAA